MADDSARTVGEIMTTDVITVKAHESLSHVRRVMSRHKIHAVPVLDDFDRLLGIVTATDFVGGMQPHEERASVGQVMQRRVFVLSPEANLLMLRDLMKRRRIHHVVITEEVGKVVGIVSAFDLLDLVGQEIATHSSQASEESHDDVAPSPAPAGATRQPPPPLPVRPSPGPAPAADPREVMADPLAEELGLVFLDCVPEDPQDTGPEQRGY
jgi:CBS domain-containing protein